MIIPQDNEVQRRPYKSAVTQLIGMSQNSRTGLQHWISLEMIMEWTVNETLEYMRSPKEHSYHETEADRTLRIARS